MKSVFLALTFFTQFALADVLFDGRFELKPASMHKPPQVGLLEVHGSGSNYDGMVFNFDKPLMGSKIHKTSEATFSSNVGPKEEKQLTVVYKIEKSPHDFYMVLVATSDTVGAKYVSKFYVAEDNINNILSRTRLFVTDADVPATWKTLGTGELNKK